MDEDDSVVPIVQVTDEESLEKLFQSIDSCSFDIFKLKNEDLPKLVERVFKNLNMFEIFPIDIRKFRTFVNFIMAQYHWHVYYHNFRHACDVVHAVYLLVNCLGGAEKLNHLEMLALLIAALCHDVDHPGLTNSFLVASDDPLAVRYNDTAVLESHHASLTIKALTGYESTNLLSIFGDSEQRHIRKLMVNCILATDMGQHGAIMNSLTSRLSDDRPFESSNKYEYVGSISQDAPRTHLPVPDTTNDAMLLLKMLIKCADISNIVKPFFLSKRWAALLALEWFHQGDLEKQLGIPVSKNMDRDQPSTFRSMSIGCIDYIGKWMYERTSVLLPLLHDEIYPNLFENRLKWTRFMFSKPFEEEMEDILGPVFPPSARQRKVSNLPEVMEHSVTELPGRGPTMLQQMKNSHALSAGKKIRERPLSLLFGAPADSNTAISTLETPWNAALRHSSVKVNVRPSPIEHDRLSWLESHDRIQYPERGSSLLSVTEEDSDSSQEGLSETTSMNAHIEGFWAKFKVAGSALRLNEAFNSRIWTCWIMIPAMLIAMFADDFVKAFLPKEFDLPTRIIYIICIVLFALDLVALSILDETYLFSLCFWLDFVGTLSLIPFVLHAFRRNFIVARVWKIAEYLCRATKKLEKAKFYNIFQAGRLLKLGLTMLTLSLIAVLSFFLSWDSNKLLIEPIERMVYFIKELADNPGSFAGKFNPQQTSSLRSGQVMETRMLEGALVKIASLSKVALGDAGMDIISVNLKGAEFNPMVPGKKVRACFGFCDIRNFTDATECLQEDVMMFVNKIADVVHNKVSAHNGFPNKNIGDAFLIVWKKTLSDGAFKSKGSSFADRALRSFLDVIQALETSQTLKEFAMHPAIQQRMPGM